jgi:hypothetical protein
MLSDECADSRNYNLDGKEDDSEDATECAKEGKEFAISRNDKDDSTGVGESKTPHTKRSRP